MFQTSRQFKVALLLVTLSDKSCTVHCRAYTEYDNEMGIR